jgi:uncharacterized YigZ family protein
LQVILKTGAADQTIHKSRFIAVALQCSNERELGAALRAFATQHQAAHHLAYAFRMRTEQGVVQRFSDAGEPSGTAGMPILKLIEGRDLMNVCIAVIRYYGGINLGTGGLARAYGGTAKMALDNCQIGEFVEMQEIDLTIAYNQMDMVTRLLSKCQGSILHKTFAEKVRLQISLPKSDVESFLSKLK